MTSRTLTPRGSRPCTGLALRKLRLVYEARSRRYWRFRVALSSARRPVSCAWQRHVSTHRGALAVPPLRVRSAIAEPFRFLPR